MNPWEIIIWVIVIIISLIAIKVNFKFDLNKHLELRRKINMDQLKNICPHIRIDKNGNQFIVESYFSSPPGTLKYICSRCRGVVESEDAVERISKSYIKNPDLFLKKEKEFIKKAKKLKIIQD